MTECEVCAHPHARLIERRNAIGCATMFTGVYTDAM